MLRGISARQFNEWMAYDELEPFDERRADIRAGSIVQAIYNVRRRKGSPPIKLMDCVVTFGSGSVNETPKSTEQAREEIVKTMDFLTMLYNTPTEKPKPRASRIE